jgi:uncharacterized protein YwqG
MDYALPAIGIIATPAEDDSLTVGCSKFGGRPDVPEGFTWPGPEGKEYYFMAQFNLYEVRKWDLNSELPSDGLLSFFMPEQLRPEGIPEIPIVYHFTEKALRRLDWPQSQAPKQVASGWLPRLVQRIKGGDFKPIVPSCRLEFENWWEVPPLDPLYVDFSEPDRDEYFEEINEGQDRPELDHRLLGYSNSTQGEVEYGAAITAGKFERKKDWDRVVEEAKNWRLLFQLSSQRPWDWGDGGELSYVIRKDDLKGGRFDRVYWEVQIG